ncbi:MAG: low molecular weight phosphotyrosine protein phosphatase [Clostridiales bacterium]|nr:low molecular weight phosphotyrosine protein phosphatase [Clostridiales bacterium]
MIKVVFVCHGNICRSTLAQSVFFYMVQEQGLADRFYIDSMATSTEEIGNPPHRGTVRKLREVGIPLVPHKAKQITWRDYDSFDYIIGMDEWNIRNLHRMLHGDPEHKVYKFLSFSGSGRDIADPWYTGDFDAAYADVLEGCNGFLEYLREEGLLFPESKIDRSRK